MIKPMHDFILVKREEKEGKTKTKSGLIIPEKQTEKYEVLKGEVIEAGPGRKTPNSNKLIETSVNKGDEILYKQYAGHKIEVDGEDLWLINERDIIATIE
jgi:chaperonin GroES